jgi:hypothetical protein
VGTFTGNNIRSSGAGGNGINIIGAKKVEITNGTLRNSRGSNINLHLRHDAVVHFENIDEDGAGRDGVNVVFDLPPEISEEVRSLHEEEVRRLIAALSGVDIGDDASNRVAVEEIAKVKPSLAAKVSAYLQDTAAVSTILATIIVVGKTILGLP